MALRTSKIFTGIGLVGIGLASASWIGFARWNNHTSGLIDRLFRASPRDKPTPVDFREIESLPAPVARYFRAVLNEGQPPVRWARIRQEGEFRARGKNGEWRPFTAAEYLFAQRPGFVWDAHIRLNPVTTVRVRDAYVAGNGSTQARIFALIPLVDTDGGKELAAAALQRYLAEAVWFPTALLPSAGVHWRGIDHRSALATLKDGDLSASLEFQFSDSGEITGVFTPGRYRKTNGQYELTPWQSHFGEYRDTHGMRIPFEAEASWQFHGESVPYFKGRNVEAMYDFAY